MPAVVLMDKFWCLRNTVSLLLVIREIKMVQSTRVGSLMFPPLEHTDVGALATVRL